MVLWITILVITVGLISVVCLIIGLTHFIQNLVSTPEVKVRKLKKEMEKARSDMRKYEAGIRTKGQEDWFEEQVGRFDQIASRLNIPRYRGED